MNANPAHAVHATTFLTGAEVHMRRLRIGWSRERLAHEVGVDAQLVESWENDNRPVTFPRAVEQVLKQVERQEVPRS